MAIGYKSAGAGAASETSGAAVSPASPATVDAGDILVVHAYFEGTTTAPSTPAGFSLLSGPHVIETTIGRHWVYGKIAAGTEDGAANALGTAAVTTMRSGRCYSFSGYVSGALAEIIRSGSFAHISNANDPQMPTVRTTKAGALAVALSAQNDNNTVTTSVGESGGDWTQPVAAFTSALTPGLGLSIHTCTPTSNPGTVSGGAASTANDPVGTIGFEIRDSPVVHSIASAEALNLLIASALTRQTFISAAEAIGLGIVTNLTTAPGFTEHFIAADFPLGLQVDSALTRQTFISAAEALNMQIATALMRETFIASDQALDLNVASALQRETFIALAQEFGLQVETAVGRETFVALGEQFALAMTSNLEVTPGITTSACTFAGPKANGEWV